MRTLSWLVPLALSCSAHAQGLVQLALSGEIDVKGGARIEIEIAALTPTSPTPVLVRFDVQFAERTSAADVATLLQRRLESARIHSVFTGDGQAARTTSSLFVDDATSIALRLGRGLHGSVALCDAGPGAVTILPPEEQKKDAVLSTCVSTLEPHDRSLQRLAFDTRLDARMIATGTADALSTASIANGWACEVVQHQTWRPGKLSSGAVIQGSTFDLQSSGDWRIEIEVARRDDSR